MENKNSISIYDGFKLGIGFTIGTLLITIILGGILLLILASTGIFDNFKSNETSNTIYPYYYK